MDLDSKIFLFLNSLAGKNQFFDSLIVFFGHYLPYVVVLVLLMFFLFYSKYRLHLFFSLINALFARVVVVEAIRIFIQRPRPFLSLTAIQLIQKGNEPSFPSGHATFFFTLAFSMFIFSKKFGWILFLSALIIGLARIISGIHYPGDILGGIFLGGIMAMILKKSVKSRITGL